MSDDYDMRLQQIQIRNESILGHFVHVWRGRISEDTLYQHVLNIQYLADNYLNHSAEADELRSVAQITAWDVYDFITDWLPRKSWDDSEQRVKSYLASFKKFVQFMGEQGYMPTTSVAEILQRLKEDRQEMINAVVTYYDEPGEEYSPEAFRSRLKEIESRWASLASGDGG